MIIIKTGRLYLSPLQRKQPSRENKLKQHWWVMNHQGRVGGGGKSKPQLPTACNTSQGREQFRKVTMLHSFFPGQWQRASRIGCPLQISETLVDSGLAFPAGHCWWLSEFRDPGRVCEQCFTGLLRTRCPSSFWVSPWLELPSVH